MPFGTTCISPNPPRSSYRFSASRGLSIVGSAARSRSTSRANSSDSVRTSRRCDFRR